MSENQQGPITLGILFVLRWTILLGVGYYLIISGILFIILPIVVVVLYYQSKKPSMSNADKCPICNTFYKSTTDHPPLSDECYSCISKDENLLFNVLKKVIMNRDKTKNISLHEKYSILNDKKLYNFYISSDIWKKKRQDAFNYYGKHCSECGVNYDLQVHHRSYVSFGNEDLKHLSILCEKCHALKH